MPREGILTESAGPFAQIDGRAVLPWEVAMAITSLADLWGSTRQEIGTILNGNLRQLVKHCPRLGINCA